jgi:hypothetical protein
MGRRYVEPRAARHRVEMVDGVEQLRIPVRRQWWVLLFLPLWLILWSAGGVMAIVELSRDFSAFLLLWLGGWAVGWLFVGATLASQWFGAEILRVAGGDLEVCHRIGPVRRTWRYHGDAIRGLQRWFPETGYMWGRWAPPLGVRPPSGSVRFDYGARSVFLAAGVDAPEGVTIAAWLARRLPRAATDAQG